MCFGSCALAAAAQAVLLIRWLLSQAAAACTGDQEVGAALPAAQSRATPEAAAVSGAPGPTPTPQSATDPDHHLLRVRLSSNWLILVFNAGGQLQFWCGAFEGW